MEFIAANEFGGYLLDENGEILETESIILSGEASFIGSAGLGSPVDSVLSYYGQTSVQSEDDMWEYYKPAVSVESGTFLKHRSTGMGLCLMLT